MTYEEEDACIPKFVLQNLQGGVSRDVQRIEARVRGRPARNL